ncbi:hypothetical protein [Nostoc sp.]|uniref:hypothetical protein n=1 Tax=Nostoc sp. TaxID=1180 RepID=UPI002FF7BD86
MAEVTKEIEAQLSVGVPLVATQGSKRNSIPDPEILGLLRFAYMGRSLTIVSNQGYPS